MADDFGHIFKWIADPRTDLELESNVWKFEDLVRSRFDDGKSCKWSNVTPYIKQKVLKLLHPDTWMNQKSDWAPIEYLWRIANSIPVQYSKDFQAFVDLLILYMRSNNGKSDLYCFSH